MKIGSVILACFVLLAVNAYGRSCKRQRSQTLAEKIASFSPTADIDLFDIDLFPGGSVATKYRYEVEPAYTHGLYQRKDRWILETRARPDGSEPLEGQSTLKYNGGIETKNEINFFRFFTDPCEALLANPYRPTHLPLKAKNALSDKFKIGDYFTFRSSVGFIVSSEILSLVTSGLWGSTLGASFLMEGFYQVHLLRIDESHIRVKILAHRGNGYKATVGLGYKKEFEVFKVNAINNQLERLVNTTPIKLEGEIETSKIFLVDYLLDLKDKEVVSAFDRIIRSPKNFKNIKLANPFKDLDLEKDVLLDLSPLEELYLADLQNNNISRIKRNLRSTSDQKTYAFSLKAGNDLLRFQREKNISNAFMSVKQESEDEDKYFMKTWKSNWEGKFLISYVKSKEEDSLNAIFKSENSIADATPINIVQEITHKKNQFSYNKYTKLQLLLKKALPASIYNEIPFESWKQAPDKKYSNFGLRYQVVMMPESITELPELTPEDVRKLFLIQMKEKGLTKEDYFVISTTEDGVERDVFNHYLKKFSKNVSEALDHDLSIKQRLSKITFLRRNPLFNQSGLGFLMSLSGSKMKERYHVDVDISSNEASIDYAFGDAQVSALYKKILSIKAALDDDPFDLLREAESVTFPVKRSADQTVNMSVL